MIKICHLTIDHPYQPVSLLRVLPYAKLKNVSVSLGSKVKKFYKKDNLITGFDLELDENIINNCDIVFIQRSFIQKSSMNVIDKVIKLNKKIIYDTDDLLVKISIANKSPFSYLHSNSKSFLIDFMPYINAFTTTNDYLSNKLKKIFNKKDILVVPNFILDEFFPKKINLNKKGNFFKIIIAGNQKIHDVELILDSLKKILHSNNDILIFFVGFQKIPDLLKQQRVVFIGQSGYSDYLYNINKIEPDLALIPLQNNEFNNCKSNIKFLEYSYLNIPGIYSKVKPYSESIENNFNGVLCEGRDEWMFNIINLFDNNKTKVNIANKARENVINKYMAKNNQNIFESICKNLA